MAGSLLAKTVHFSQERKFVLEGTSMSLLFAFDGPGWGDLALTNCKERALHCGLCSGRQLGRREWDMAYGGESIVSASDHALNFRE